MANPASAATYGLFTYTDNGTSITITKYTGTGGAVTIPGTINGLPVTTIGDSAFLFSNLTSITIPVSVTSIGAAAFSYCSSLTDITIPASVTSIGDSAFAYCSGLTSVTIPEGVTTLGASAFYYCSGLTSITIPASVTTIGDLAFSHCDRLTAISVDALNSSYSSTNGILFDKSQTTLIQCPGGKSGSITIPAGVTTVRALAFTFCFNPTSITIPASVTTIGDSAFVYCSSLTSVTIPSSVTTIGTNAFSVCSSLTSARFLGNAPILGLDVFSSAASGFTVYCLNSATGFSSPTWMGYTTIRMNAFIPPLVTVGTASGITAHAAYLNGTVNPNGMVTSAQFEYGLTASYGNKRIVTLTPNNGTTEQVVRVNITGLQAGTTYHYRLIATDTLGADMTFTTEATLGVFNFTISNGYVTITKYTGTGGAVSIPGTINDLPVTTIGDRAFGYCYGLTSVTIPSSVTSIGASAFNFCSGLTSITIPASVTTIGNHAFQSCASLTSITIPASVTSIGDSAFAYCSNLTSITIPPSVTSIGGGAFGGCSSLTSIAIPAGVTTIRDNAFSNCSNLTSITIPPSVTSIGANAFDHCVRLTSISIPSGVTSIGDRAFYTCVNLTSIGIPVGVTSIGASVFESCLSLTSITIPNGVTTIGDSAFIYCTKLTSVMIPASVTSIGIQAFRECSSLISITIPAGVATIGNYAFYGCPYLTGACFTGNSPSMGLSVFGAASGFKVYYFNGKTGFTSPSWLGYPAVNMGASTPVANWLLTHSLPYNADLQSDPNGDGVSLLMAYALNLNPAQNLSGSLPRPVIAGGQMGLTFYAGTTGVTYTVETSTDLTNWSATGVTVSAPDANNVRTATVPTTDPNRFMRLVVSY